MLMSNRQTPLIMQQIRQGCSLVCPHRSTFCQTNALYHLSRSNNSLICELVLLCRACWNLESSMLVTPLYPFYFVATYFEFTQLSSHSTTTCPFVRGIKWTPVTCPKTQAHVRKLYKPISQVKFLFSSFLINYLLWFFFPLTSGVKTKFLAL